MKTATSYTTRILKGAALVPYAKTLLREFDPNRTLEENLAEHRRSAVFGKATARRADDILGILEERYLRDEDVRRGLLLLVRSPIDSAAIDLILGYHAANADPLLFDFAADFLFGMRERGITAVGFDDAMGFLRSAGLLGDGGRWSNATAAEVARKLLTAWRDFGLLEGAVNKRITPTSCPAAVALWVATFRRDAVGTLRGLCDDRAFRVLLLRPDEVEELLHQSVSRGLIHIQGAGLSGRIDWRFSSLEELARALN